MPTYSVDAKKFGKGTSVHDFTLTGMIDEVINLENLVPHVNVDQNDVEIGAVALFNLQHRWSHLPADLTPVGIELEDCGPTVAECHFWRQRASGELIKWRFDGTAVAHQEEADRQDQG